MLDNGVVTTEEKFPDILNRQEFVDRIIQISEALAENEKTACYAINGGWGVGKSFVLDMFEKQAEKIGQEGTTLPKFLVLRYNCWEYDYYEEPLIAIVAAVLDEIDKKVNLLSQETRTKVTAVLKTVGMGLANRFAETIKEKTGIDAKQIVEMARSGANAIGENEKEVIYFDQYISFKKRLKELKKAVEDLAENQTVIFIVDELDRCLPEYSIKVLERLHHLFSDIPNVQVVLSVDKMQIANVVHRIYGENTDVDNYLAKFIAFELTLTEGSISDEKVFEERFKEYLSRFKCQYSTTKDFEVNDFCKTILDGIDMRSRIAIIEKCLLIHSILVDENEKLDSMFMCIELLLVVLKWTKADVRNRKNAFSINDVFFEKSGAKITSGLEELAKLFKDNAGPFKYYARHTEGGFGVVYGKNVYGTSLYAYRQLIGCENDYLSGGEHIQDKISQFTHNFWAMLRLIR